MVNFGHCFDFRNPSEFSPTRPSKNSILFLANLRGAKMSSSSCIRGSMFFNERGNAVFHIIVRGLLSLGRSRSMINILGALNCLTYSGIFFFFSPILIKSGDCSQSVQ